MTNKDMSRKGAGFYGIIIGLAVMFIFMNAFALYFPEITGDVTGLDTSQLQSDTEINETFNANATDSSNAIEQGRKLLSIYSLDNQGNQILIYLGMLLAVITGGIILKEVWIG